MRDAVGERRAVLAGVGVFLALAPMLALARQAMLLLVAGAIGAATRLLEHWLLPLLPVDPVYGGAGLRVLGGIEPRGLAVAGWPGAALHTLLPAAFGRPDLVPAGAVVSALMDPGITVLARVLAAILATSALVALAGLTATRLRNVSLAVAARLGQIWLLLDLAHEADLSIRDLEATGLPFALAALMPVDAQGQRVLFTSHVAGVPDTLIGGATAIVAVLSCLMLAAIPRSSLKLLALLAQPQQLRALRLPRPGRVVSQVGRLRIRRPVLGPSALRFSALVLFALCLNVTPLRTLAEGEASVLLPIEDASAASPPAPYPAPEALAEPVRESEVVQPSAAAAVTPTIAASPTPDVPPLGSRVAVEGGGYQYTLRVNGRPTVVRGMGYNPWYASLPVEERRARYRRDFSAMREVGINTLEGWFQDQFDEVTLDEAHRQGLKVIMPFELNQDYDYADPATRRRFRDEVTAWVLRYREHPAVLMWGPGNEVMHRLIFPTAVQGRRDLHREQRADDFAAFYVELMDTIHQLDPHHPVIYRDAEDLYFARLREQLRQGGARRPWFVYGTNVYTNRIAEVIERWPGQGLDAPLLVSEFSPGGAGESDRPRMLGWYWSTIRAHPRRVLGGVVYTWATRGPEDLDRVFGLTDEAGVPVDGSLAALRGLFREDVGSRREPT